MGKPAAEGKLGNRREQAEGALREPPIQFLQLCHPFANCLSLEMFSLCHAPCWALKVLRVETGVTDFSQLSSALSHPRPLTLILAPALHVLRTPEGALVRRSEDGGAYTERVIWARCLHLEMGRMIVPPSKGGCEE